MEEEEEEIYYRNNDEDDDDRYSEQVLSELRDLEYQRY